ncbi:MAG TPA: 2,3-bisphosphoglycerate-independent phosphoglycerate mutase [Candidatus Limnocylindria bacterium]|nr:2,3-bisphosphoglycerate-independent phosphoglycerate mutase [Candidatus Limnocylindria bacterium]
MAGGVRPVVLCVLDGFGLGADPSVDAVAAADMRTWRRLWAGWPHARLAAAGEAVGLPAGQMGNSEVGHLNLGAGFPVLQDLPRINRAIADGSFAANPALFQAVRHARDHGGTLHLLGLVGPGGIHAVDEHIVAMAELAQAQGLPADRVLLHAFTDGRDTPPRSAAELVPALLRRLDGKATPATVLGRYWAMDRDGRWERTRLAYEAIVHGTGPTAADAVAAIAAAHANGIGDEFIEPTIVLPGTRVRPGDAIVHLNFRADRARQLTQALALPAFSEFDRGDVPAEVSVTTLTQYQDRAELPVEVAFGPVVADGLAAHLARLGLRQLHLAETEKYAHVTYFFNGGVEDPFPGEDRILVPSRRDVPTYDFAPEMSAEPITDHLVAAVEGGGHAFIVVNYANPDMVGHTGVWDAAVAALEFVDACLARVEAAVLAAGGALVITADHGNVERMRDIDGQPHTAHTTADVPIVLVGEPWRGAGLRDGTLADVAPTLCELLGIDIGPQMTGRSLLASVASG